jgi:predicted O-methyltransferase YrrM
MNIYVYQFLLDRVLNGRGDSDKHSLSIFGMTLSLNPKKILELGVREGETTLPFLAAAKELGAHVHSVDLEMTTFDCPTEYLPFWTFTQSDAIAFLENRVSENASYDIVYIDDWHSYDHVKKELSLVEKMITPSSIVLLHDLMYSNYQPDYHSNLSDPDPQWAEGGPYRAVAELDTNKWEWCTLPTNHGLTILRKKGNVKV